MVFSTPFLAVSLLVLSGFNFWSLSLLGSIKSPTLQKLLYWFLGGVAFISIYMALLMAVLKCSGVPEITL